MIDTIISYCDTPEYDVTILFNKESNSYRCIPCNLGDTMRPMFETETAHDMGNHLRNHAAKGHKFPFDIYEKLSQN
jgi:hypothetical protein